MYREGALCVYTSVEIGCCMGYTSVKRSALFVYTSIERGSCMGNTSVYLY